MKLAAVGNCHGCVVFAPLFVVHTKNVLLVQRFKALLAPRFGTLPIILALFFATAFGGFWLLVSTHEFFCRHEARVSIPKILGSNQSVDEYFYCNRIREF